MSIQGVQPKLSARLNARAGQFELVDQGGTYILKPPSPSYAHLPENEDLAMRLAKTVGIEEFAQLSLRNRTTKYDSSMEQVASVMEKYATFPKVEFLDLSTRTIFCFLTGGEDMHLKNFSLITRGTGPASPWKKKKNHPPGFG